MGLRHRRVSGYLRTGGLANIIALDMIRKTQAKAILYLRVDINAMHKLAVVIVFLSLSLKHIH